MLGNMRKNGEKNSKQFTTQMLAVDSKRIVDDKLKRQSLTDKTWQSLKIGSLRLSSETLER